MEKSLSGLTKSDMNIPPAIQTALRLKESAGQDLLQDTALRTLLSSLDRSIEETRKAMIETGMLKECADCASAGGGFCCVRPVSYNCDSVLLLINLLLAVSLPVHPADPDSCYFLTQRGCSLRARPVICLNYLCRRLKNSIPPEKLIRFQEIAGQEMDNLFRVEEYLKKSSLPVIFFMSIH